MFHCALPISVVLCMWCLSLPTSAKKLLRSAIAGHLWPSHSKFEPAVLQCCHLGFPGIFDTPKDVTWFDWSHHINGNICVQAIPRPLGREDFTKSHLLRGFTILLKADCVQLAQQGSHKETTIQMVSKWYPKVPKWYPKVSKRYRNNLYPWQSRIFGSFCLFALFEFFGYLSCLDFFCRVLMFSASTYSHVTVISLVVARINVDIWWYLCIVRVEPQKRWQGDTTYCVFLSAIFKNISQWHPSILLDHFWAHINAMFCHFPLNLAVWPQPSRFRKAEIQICAFLRGFAPCLRACFGPECITLLLKKMSMGLDGEELK